jgi:hypothetical protein
MLHRRSGMFIHTVPFDVPVSRLEFGDAFFPVRLIARLFTVTMVTVFCINYGACNAEQHG